MTKTDIINEARNRASNFSNSLKSMLIAASLVFVLPTMIGVMFEDGIQKVESQPQTSHFQALKNVAPQIPTDQSKEEEAPKKEAEKTDKSQDKGVKEVSSVLEQATGSVKAEAKEDKPEPKKEVATAEIDSIEGVQPEVIEAIKKVSDKYDLDYRYLLTVCMSENCKNPAGIGDKGCSFGIFQMNMCSGDGRLDEKHLGKKLKDCALDYECASDWTLTVHTIHRYCTIKDGQIRSWIGCLSKHQGGKPRNWYVDKITRNGANLGLKL